MSFVFLGLAALLGIAAFVMQIMVCVKMMQNDQTALGVVGICIGLIPLIVGWMNATKWNIKNLMIAWTGSIVGAIIFNVIGSAMAAAAAGGG